MVHFQPRHLDAGECPCACVSALKWGSAAWHPPHACPHSPPSPPWLTCEPHLLPQNPRVVAQLNTSRNEDCLVRWLSWLASMLKQPSTACRHTLLAAVHYFQSGLQMLANARASFSMWQALNQWQRIVAPPCPLQPLHACHSAAATGCRLTQQLSVLGPTRPSGTASQSKTSLVHPSRWGMGATGCRAQAGCMAGLCTAQ